MSGALIGFAGAVGALGGVFINVVLRASYVGDAKSATNAFWVFLAFYVVCAIVTWVVFLRIARAPGAFRGAHRSRCRSGANGLVVVRTACSYCGVGCGIAVQTRTDPVTGAPVIARVSGDKLHPTNFGRLCTKGATHAEMMARRRRPADVGAAAAVARRRPGGRRRRRRGRPKRAGGCAPSSTNTDRTRWPSTSPARCPSNRSIWQPNSRRASSARSTSSPIHGCAWQAPERATSSRWAPTARPAPTPTSTCTNLFFVIGSNMADCHPILFLEWPIGSRRAPS